MLRKPAAAWAAFHVMPPTHLAYVATWWTLAGLGVVLTRKRFRLARR
jgi:hypothetical protein